MSDTHAVFARLTDGTEIRISPWTQWRDAIDRWELLDDTLRSVKASKEGWTSVNYFAVRHHGDPRWTPAPYAPEKVLATVGKGSKEETPVLKRIGKVKGLEGRAGGWIYRNGTPITQGWWSFIKDWTRQGHFITREFSTGRTYERQVRPYRWNARTETVVINERRYFTNAFSLDLAVATQKAEVSA